MKKTIFCILTVLMLILNLQISFVGAEEAIVKPEEAELLNALSLLDEEGFAENDYFTRAEFCGFLCKLFNFELVSDGSVEFRDIDETHEHFNAVSCLYNMGIIKGLSKYSFAPNRNITAEEAATIIVTALGHSEIADAKNQTMLVTANQLGLFDGISVSGNSNITEEFAKKLMYNTLFAPITRVELSGNKVLYNNDEKLMMNEIYNLYEVKGIVTEDSTTSLFGESRIKENEVRIDMEIYQNEMENINSLMGYSVYAYVKYDADGVGTVIYAKENSKDNNVYEFVSDDVLSLNDNYINIECDGRSKKVDLANPIDAIYNGIGIKNFESSMLKPTYGKVKLIDNTGDNKADVAIITEYKSIAVQSVVSSENEFRIYDKYGNHLTADLVAKDCVINVWKNGKTASISDITSGSAVLVVDSGARDKTRLIDVYLYNEKLSGILSGISDTEITLDGQNIPISPYFDRDSVNYYMSKKVSAYVDINGKVSFVTIESGGQYGFLYKAIWQDVEEDLLCVIYTTDNELKKYTLPEKLLFNNQSKTDAEIYTALLDGNESVEQQVVRFETNDNGEITKLYTAQFRTKADGELDLDYDAELRDKGMFRRSMLLKNRQWVHTVGGMWSKTGQSSWIEVFFSGTVPVLVRPEGEVTSEKDMYWYTQSYFILDNGYLCEGFDLREDNTISAMVVYQNISYGVKKYDNFVVVDEITTEINEDEEVVRMLWGYYKGVLTGFEAANENAFLFEGQEVKRGDVVKLAKDNNNKVDHLQEKLRFRVTSPDSYITNYNDQDSDTSSDLNSAHAARAIPVGKVSKVYGNWLQIEVQNNKHINILLKNATKYIVYDSKQANGYELRVGTKNDMAIGDYIVAGLYYSTTEDIVIYKLD